MNLREMAVKWLKDNGYSGLYNEEIYGCGCEVDDLMPCGEPNPNCEPGYKVKATPENCEDWDESLDWVMCRKKQEAPDADK